MNKIADSGIRIPCTLDDFFEKWFQILKPIHKLSGTEIRLIAEFCRIRHELSKKITDIELLNEYLFSVETKLRVRERLNMTAQSYQVAMHKLKKAGIIKDNKINPLFIPKLSNEENYKLMLYFDMNGSSASNSTGSQS